MSRQLLMMLVSLAMFVGACGTTPNTGTADDRALLRSQAEAALADFKTTDSTLVALLNSSHGYVIFPRVVTVAVGLGGAHGKGEVYQNGKLVGYADVSQGSVGAQLGAQKYGELILFRTEGSFVDFQHGGNYEIDARATAIAAANGAARTADYSRGVLVFTLPESGLMAQAALGVQKFRYIPANP